MVMTPQNIAAALAARPEVTRLGASRLSQDQGAFKTMLTSELGVSQEVLRGKGKDALSLLKQNSPTTPGFQDAQATVGKGASGAMQALMREQAKAQNQSQSQTQNQAQAKSTAPVRTGEVRGKIASNEARGVINLNARHSEDLGHLPGNSSKTGLPAGFTKAEEDLLFAAAAAESKFLAAKRQSVLARDDAKYERSDKIGILSAAYESRGAIDAIGYDGRGGTSYGTYQIASGVGTMSRFLNYLEAKAPDLAARLSTSGPANTGGREGAMANEWKNIASQHPKRFEALQHEFIGDTHYQPALKSVTLSTGEDLSKRSQAVREVLWSTAVQHGPNGAADIFTSAVEKLQAKGQEKSDKALIEEVYAQRMTQFAGRGRLRVAVTTRLADEKESALAMLGGRSLS
ncbi:VgrG-related protein [Fundidesulfovibrio putealis]|uniref:VgrG-related protein n=1 Tax=Fundidesulfovibrio putealis TaxID=270496 RepID=UPI000A02416E|nr:chitosanase [Fundidesulfovibrio putealis]